MAREAGERKKSVPKEWLSVRNRESGRGGELKIIALSPPPTSPSTLTQKSNMAGRINDPELITLARTNKTPTLLAKLVPHIIPSANCSMTCR